MTLKKKLILAICSLFTFLIFNTQSIAQDVSISDEELTLYASVMTKIDSMKLEMKTKYNSLIKDEPTMTGGKRFKEIKGAKGDEAKLTEINATEDELIVFSRIQKKYTSMTENFKATYPTLIKEELGASVYNKVKKALKTNSELKTKYEEIVALLQSEDAESTNGE